ncbi:MAG TPA: DUF4129 domain-containing protein [Puia sp.]|jgi:hypothetical protein|nr:DUF4129 domain-containing protein [Puia sp.]
MYALFDHIKRITGPVATCVLLTASLCCPAQQRTRLPDSIPGSAENTSPVIDSTSAAGDSAVVGLPDSGRHEDKTTRHEPASFRRIPDSVITRLKKEKDFAYANDPAYWTRDKKDNGDSPFLQRLLSSRWFQYSIYLLLAAILLYAFYKIISENNLRIFYRKGTLATAQQQGDGSLEEEDLDEGLTRAMTAEDHRLAVHYLFLKTLRLLDTAGLIRYHAQVTNEEYISQMSQLPQGAAFRYLTGAYERVWYGDFAITRHQFDGLLQSFRDFYKSIPSN